LRFDWQKRSEIIAISVVLFPRNGDRAPASLIASLTSPSRARNA